MRLNDIYVKYSSNYIVSSVTFRGKKWVQYATKPIIKTLQGVASNHPGSCCLFRKQKYDAMCVLEDYKDQIKVKINFNIEKLAQKNIDFHSKVLNS